MVKAKFKKSKKVRTKLNLLNTLANKMNITIYISQNWNYGCGDFYPANLSFII